MDIKLQRLASFTSSYTCCGEVAVVFLEIAVQSCGGLCGINGALPAEGRLLWMACICLGKYCIHLHPQWLGTISQHVWFWRLRYFPFAGNGYLGPYALSWLTASLRAVRQNIWVLMQMICEISKWLVGGGGKGTSVVAEHSSGESTWLVPVEPFTAWLETKAYVWSLFLYTVVLCSSPCVLWKHVDP